MSGRHRRGHLPRVVTLSLALALVTTPLAVRPAVAAEADPPVDSAESALAQLRDQATGEVDVARDEAGAVTSVTSADGSAVLETTSGTPARAAAEVLDAHGEAFGLDGEWSQAVVTQALPSATGGAVVRAQQRVDGLPVFGGQVVTVLDEDADVVSLEAATTREPVEASRPEVGGTVAVRTAVRASARAHGRDAATLSGELLGRRLFDPVLVGVTTPGGVRPVWEVEVRDGATVRDTVLVGTDRGEVALRFDNAPAATSRWVCDNAGRRAQEDGDLATVCAVPAMQEGDSFESPSPFDPDARHPEVQSAYRHLGATEQTFRELRAAGAPDLTSMLGTVVGGQKRLAATVRWCVSDKRCPYENGYWDGRQVVLGEGYAAADDVIAHELTHGFVQKTSNLFYFHQSGAINESMADVLGEIVDHRHGDDDDSAWTIGEDLPDGAMRSLANPRLTGLPDRMTSSRWVDEAAFHGDDGGVHSNLGVGNKTAHLISQGGAFNGQTIVGIDGDDPTLSKTGLLYLEVVQSLTSASDYADLGRVLEATCTRLASAGTGGFAAADCVAVRQAALATELSEAPVSGRQPASVEASCPEGTTQRLSARDDDAAVVSATSPGVPGFDFDLEPASLAGYLGAGQHGQFAVSGEESLLLLDPDPGRLDAAGQPEPSTVTARSRPLRVPVASGGSYLHFHHAYAFDELGGQYYDGGRVRVWRQVGTGWSEVDPLVWTNGPDRTVIGSGTRFTGFGGDSRGWGSSRIDLTTLAGQTVRVDFVVEADHELAAYGWWLDDIRLYSCLGPAPGAPTAVSAVATGTTSARLGWGAPTAGAVAGFQVLVNGVQVAQTGAASRSHPVTGLTPGSSVTLGVRTLATDGQVSAASSRVVAIPSPPPPPPPTPTPTPTPAPTVKPTVKPTVRPVPTVTPTPVVRKAVRAVTTTSTSRVRRNQAFVVRGTALVRGTGAKVRGVRITLQRRVGGTSRWRTVSTRTTRTDGAYRWRMQQKRSTAYRVVVSGSSNTLRSVSPGRGVRLVR